MGVPSVGNSVSLSSEDEGTSVAPSVGKAVFSSVEVVGEPEKTLSVGKAVSDKTGTESVGKLVGTVSVGKLVRNSSVPVGTPVMSSVSGTLELPEGASAIDGAAEEPSANGASVGVSVGPTEANSSPSSSSSASPAIFESVSTITVVETTVGAVCDDVDVTVGAVWDVVTVGADWDVVVVTTVGTDWDVVVVTTVGTDWEVVVVTTVGTDWEVVVVTTVGTDWDVAVVIVGAD